MRIFKRYGCSVLISKVVSLLLYYAEVNFTFYDNTKSKITVQKTLTQKNKQYKIINKDVKKLQGSDPVRPEKIH